MKTDIMKLKNGVTILFTHKPNDKFISATYAFEVGSVDEGNRERFGMSHFLEHMCFNGTENYDKDQINNLPEELGGTINANTCRNVTQYEVQALKENYKEILALISDLVFKPIFPIESFKKEKGIVIQEIAQSTDNPWSVMWDEKIKTVNETRLQHPVLGYKDTVNAFNRHDLMQYHKEYYTLNNCVISICCDLFMDDVIETILNLLPDHTNSRCHRLILNHNYITDYKEFFVDNFTQNKLVRSIFIDDYYLHEFSIITQIFGGGLGSRMVQELREKQSLCYQTGCDLKRTGHMFELYMYISYEDDSKTHHIISEMDRLFKELNTITNEELERAKNCIIGELYRDFECSLDISSGLTKAYISGRNMDLEKDIEKINNCILKDIKQALSTIYDDNFSTTVMRKGQKNE